MKTSTKFWISVFTLLFIGLQFNNDFIKGEIIILNVGLVFYFWFCIVYLFFYFFNFEKEDLEIHKLSILYCFNCVPITKFNNYLNSI